MLFEQTQCQFNYVCVENFTVKSYSWKSSKSPESSFEILFNLKHLKWKFRRLQFFFKSIKVQVIYNYYSSMAPITHSFSLRSFWASDELKPKIKMDYAKLVFTRQTEYKMIWATLNTNKKITQWNKLPKPNWNEPNSWLKGSETYLHFSE